jgi:hypothetical protein
MTLTGRVKALGTPSSPECPEARLREGGRRPISFAGVEWVAGKARYEALVIPNLASKPLAAACIALTTASLSSVHSAISMFEKLLPSLPRVQMRYVGMIRSPTVRGLQRLTVVDAGRELKSRGL